MKNKILLVCKTIINLFFDDKDKKLIHFCRFFFTILEWTVILATVKFVQIKTNDILFKFLFNTGTLILCIFITKKLCNILSYFFMKITKEKLKITKNKLNQLEKYLIMHKYKKQSIIFWIICAIIGFFLGLWSSLSITRVIEKLLITL